MVEHNEASVMEEELPKNSTKTIEPLEETPSSSNDEDSKKRKDGKPHQIVSIGIENDTNPFTFHEDLWNEILGQVPPGWKVAVVSVVGAFRTGKSFLLSWFLQYLYALEEAQKENKSLEDSEIPWYKKIESLGKDGFSWKAGNERNTTGIWMWSHPFFLENKQSESMAVLLVDTQGMFDNETTMNLTASIFGLSTLLSSYQIYNVDKRIQEDNLQQLGLFCEYARTAMGKADFERKPFQRMEFLVRDWQNFDDHEDEGNLDAMEKSMAEYLDTVLAKRDASELKETREQIQECFEEFSCYGLCHPGLDVPKKKFAGEVSKVRELFLQLLDRYCKRVFSSTTLQPKQIHDRELTAVELGTFIKSYVGVFISGEDFPTAATLLEATASANNSNALAQALNEYKSNMDLVAGPRCSNYIQPRELLEEHETNHAKAMKLFNSMATFGSRKSVDVVEKKLTTQLEQQWQVYESLNSGRNPLLGLEVYFLPMLIAFAAYILRHLTDFTCSPYSDICKASSEVLSHTYAVVFFFLAIIAATKARQIQEWAGKFQAALSLVLDAKNNDGAPKAKKN